jgi:hypothetical protein
LGRRSSFTAKQKAELVLSVVTKQSTIAEAVDGNGITETTFMQDQRIKRLVGLYVSGEVSREHFQSLKADYEEVKLSKLEA